MAWCRPGNKPLSEPMMTYFPDAYDIASLSLSELRGGTPPWGVIFHENVNFLFVAKKCKVTHTFHKIHKQYVIAAIETHILVNFFNKTVFGDYVFLPKIKMVSSIQLNILENSFTLQEYHIHRYIGHVLLNKMIENWTL